LLDLSDELIDSYLMHLGQASWPEKVAVDRGFFISRLLEKGVSPIRIVESLRSHISDIEIVEILVGVDGLTADMCLALGPLGSMLALRRRRGIRARLMWHAAVLSVPSCFDALPLADVPYISLSAALDDWPYRQAGCMMKLVDMGTISRQEQSVLEAFGVWLDEFLMDHLGSDIEAIWRESKISDAARAKLRGIFSGDDFLANIYRLPEE